MKRSGIPDLFRGTMLALCEQSCLATGDHVPDMTRKVDLTAHATSSTMAQRPGCGVFLYLGVLVLSLVLLAASLASGATQTRSDTIAFNCKVERASLYNETKFTVVLGATAGTKQDNDPHTIEFFMVNDLPKDQNHITEDGQAIYLTAGIKDDETKSRLTFAAFNRQLALKLGTDACQMQSAK